MALFVFNATVMIKSLPRITDFTTLEDLGLHIYIKKIIIIKETKE